MTQRIGLAQALLNDPDLVFLDEPTSGLDPLGRLLVRDLLRELRAKGTTVFLNSHLLGEVEATCDRVVFVKQGRTIHERTLAADSAQLEVELRLGRSRPRSSRDCRSSAPASPRATASCGCAWRATRRCRRLPAGSSHTTWRSTKCAAGGRHSSRCFWKSWDRISGPGNGEYRRVRRKRCHTEERSHGGRTKKTAFDGSAGNAGRLARTDRIAKMSTREFEVCSSLRSDPPARVASRRPSNREHTVFSVRLRASVTPC